jgi:hypothetical protein
MPTKKAAKKAAAKPAEAPQAAAKPKKASKYPYKKLVVPAALQGVENGKLSGKILRGVKCGGQMYIEAAEAFDRMYDQAILSGIKLRNIGNVTRSRIWAANRPSPAPGTAKRGI